MLQLEPLPAEALVMTLLAIAQSLAVGLTISLVWVAVQVVEALAAQDVLEAAEIDRLPAA